ITETVTKGLDENVEMKDSGIEWIGEIPEHWQAIKLKYFYNIISGTTPTNKDENWNGEILWITPADYNTEDISIKDSKRKITKLGVENSSLSVIPI
ncbi:restriction endonuclease subunit S, partial [Algoriphagus aestuarii]|nr:restriction endonuclease subunit S [Algoriphagus aestuarii]